jgi:hypothetical protein
MKKNVFVLLGTATVLATAIAVGACASKKIQAKEAAQFQFRETIAKETITPDDGQNPAMNFIGNYYGGRACISVEAKGSDEAEITVVWGDSYNTKAVWTMSGTFNEDKKVFEENMLFATLDTYQRRVDIDKNRSFILVDTIGFVSRLPHLLIDAFKSTLEIVTEADLLIHVVDSSYENSDFQAEVTDRVLEEIGAGSKPKIKAFNKVDLIEDKGDLTLKGTGKDSFFISAKYDIGIDALMDEVKIRIFGDLRRARAMQSLCF